MKARAKQAWLTLSHVTFQHRAGFSPYTSSYEFARTCVFVKQSTPTLSLWPIRKSDPRSQITDKHNNLSGIRTQVSDIRIGRASFEITPSCFAEFLKLPSLVLLGLLDQSTSVGFRYDLMQISLRGFSWIVMPSLISWPKPQDPITAQINASLDLPGLTALLLRCCIHYNTEIDHHRHPPTRTIHIKDRNINR